MIWLSVLISTMAFSAEPAEIWTLSFKGEKPVAVFFDAMSGSLYVSVKEGDRARLDRVSLEGKLEKRAMATLKGEPGPLRAYDGKLYWLAGSSVQLVDPKGGRGVLPHFPTEAGTPLDIAIA